MIGFLSPVSTELLAHVARFVLEIHNEESKLEYLNKRTITH